MYKQFRVDLQSRSQSQPFNSLESPTKSSITYPLKSALKYPTHTKSRTPIYSVKQYFDAKDDNNYAEPIYIFSDPTHMNKASSTSTHKQPSYYHEKLSSIGHEGAKTLHRSHTKLQLTLNKINPPHKAVNEVDLIDPILVRNTKQLKIRSKMPQSAKKRILESFGKVRKEYFSTTPMDVEFNILGQKYQQRKRDINHQGKFYGQPVSAVRFSRSLLRSWRQLTSSLTLKDMFQVQLNRQDVQTIIKKQPKGLTESISVDHLLQHQDIEFDDEINFQRKRSLVETIFSDKHFSVKDREILYHVIIYQTESAIKQQEIVDRVGMGVKGLGPKKRSRHVENLRQIISYIVDNYAHLVKRES